MAGRIRSIKPEVLEDEEAAGLSDGAWRLWISLWALADDHGNTRSSAKWLAGQVWWASGRSHVAVEQLINELHQSKRIELYMVRGERYLHIRNWEKHQRIDNAGKNRVPLPSEGTPVVAMIGGTPPTFAEIHGELPLRSPTSDPEGDLDPDHRPPDSGESGSVASPLTLVPVEPPAPRFDFVAVYKAHYPRKEGRKRGLEICEAEIKSEADFVSWKQAVQNFAALMRTEGRPVDRTKHFDSFMAVWRDYIDITPASGVMDAESAEKGRSLF